VQSRKCFVRLNGSRFVLTRLRALRHTARFMSAHLPKPSVSLWRDAAFLRLFIANTLSALGSAVSLMALPLTAVGMLHANASQMGVLAACELLPFITVGLPAGVWIDRASKKRLTVLFNFVAAFGLGLVPLCWLLGCLQIEVLYAVGFVASTCEAVGGSASQVLVTLMFGRERLVEANSKLSVAGSVSQICGPALGALLVAAFGAPLAVTADALSFVVAGVLIGRIAVQEKAGTRSRASMLVQIREGLKLVWHTPMLRGLIVVVAVWILLSDSFKALYVLYASRNLGLGAAAIGLINMLGALGGLLGAPLADRLSQRHGMRLTLLGGVALAGVGYLAYALPQADWPLTSLWAGLALFVYNLGGTVYVVNYLSLRLAVTPDLMLGRMVTSMRFATILPGPFATIAIGHSADRFGLPPVFAGLGVACISVALLGVFCLPRQWSAAGPQIRTQA
jgi:MFS family permease